jgi:hypothetical protein
MSNLELFRNNDFEISITLNSRDLETNVITPLDLTGAKLHFIVSKNRSSEPIIHKEITTFEDEDNGLAKITLTNAETDVQEGTYKYEIKLEDPSGKLTTILVGDFIIKQIVKSL